MPPKKNNRAGPVLRKRPTQQAEPTGSHKLEADATQKATVKSQATPRTSRSSKPGAGHAYGVSEQERNEDEEKYAKHLVNNYTHRGIDRLLDFAQPAATAGQEAAQNDDFISDAMERILTGKKLPNGSGLDRRLLMPLARGIGKWAKVKSSIKSEKPLYGYFSDFVLFVAQCLKSVAAGNNTHIARLVLPAERTDFKPDDSNDSRRIDVGLAERDIGDSVKLVSLNSYADMLCIAEAKHSRALDKNALVQLFLYSANLYARQANRRYLWGLTICADEVYACMMLNDGLFISPAMRISELAGRKMLISWLVRWSMCPEDRLGYDPTICRVIGQSDADVGGNNNGDDVDDIMYTIDCYDDKSKKTTTYITNRTITSADDMLGRHTRCFIATRCSDSDTESSGEEVVIKDAWPPAKYPPLKDPRDEIKLLRKIHDTFKKGTPDHIYPDMIVGGHVRLNPKDKSAIDTTDAIFNAAGVDRIDPPSDSDVRSTWNQQPLRAHRRIVMSPVGHSLKKVQNEAELIIVLVEAMQCYSSVLGRCGVLHRDISANNILVVRDGEDTIPRGLLIDFDFAIKVDTQERSARPARSGTMPYMSIANILNLDTPRTALDDWESLLYVVCWLATVGISSDHRVPDAELAEMPIRQWRTGTTKMIANAKRTHMHTGDIFQSNIVKEFCAQYKLLPRFAKALHKALFGNENCPGAHLDDVDDEESSDDDDEDSGDKPTDSPNDPLVKRGAHVDEILANLDKVLDKFKRKALAALTV
ncbi:hypothetical protein GGH12_003082 [Coemansia sp. RSA 1822]|nr:hypothetical protein GGH12_003082 [Coemansia sp. RSA 1822]